MSNLTRFNPFNDIARLDPFANMGDVFRGFGMRPLLQEFEHEPQMRMDVTEADGAYKVKAEIPGVTKEDIHISVDGNLVSISAEVKKEKEEKKDGNVIRSERYFGQVSRSFTLASDVDADKVQAKYANGVLELSLPKKANGQKKSITVS